jgi:hypothetical protein
MARCKHCWHSRGWKLNTTLFEDDRICCHCGLEKPRYTPHPPHGPHSLLTTIDHPQPPPQVHVFVDGVRINDTARVLLERMGEEIRLNGR